MAQWHNIIPSTALAPGDVVEASWQGDDILVYRTTDNSCHAISAYCPHMGNYIPNGLAPGQALNTLLKKERLCCPFHGWQFDGEGHCTHIPQGQRIPPRVRRGQPIARSWAVRECEQQIQIAER